jgi:predicted transposase/invertase (TIGR01784 family)
MQIEWMTAFMQRMLFNASKAYVRQLKKGEHYELLKPVYGLGLLNATFDPNENDWYHHYKIVNVEKPQAEIKDLQLVFIELPKFKAKNFPERKLQVLWLRFMSELDEKTKSIPAEWLAVPEIKQAVELTEEAAYTENELAGYDKYWDAVSIEKTLLTDHYRKGVKEGRQEGKQEGILEGILENKRAVVQQLLAKGLSVEEIASLMPWSLADIIELAKENP